MREISCRDIGVGCDFVARGATDEEVLRARRSHGRNVHGMERRSSDLEQKVHDHIRTDWSDWTGVRLPV
jgi:predicted small metal-binding protein